MNRVATEAFTEIGLPALVLAGGGPEGACPDGPAWALVRGWADLDSTSLLDTSHRFPAYFVTQLFTAMAVLRLVADGRSAWMLPRTTTCARFVSRTMPLARPATVPRAHSASTAGTPT